jgi:curli biogenesis system outer membrane secretion channel CsgG
MKRYFVIATAAAAVLAATLPVRAEERPTPAAAPKIAAARKPAAPTSVVDTVIELVKGGMSEAMVIKTLQRQNTPIDLKPAEMLRLQKAGVSENIISVMMDPNAAAAPAPVPAAAVQPAAPVEAAPAPVIPEAPAGRATPYPPPLGGTPSGPQKRRLAVNAFDYSAVKTAVAAVFQNDVNIGEGIRAMLTARLQQANTITLVERTKVETILKEQDFGATNRVNQGKKAKIGKLSGADAILLGDIVIFGQDDKTKHRGFGGVLGPRLGGIATFNKEEKAVVGINLRIVDAETGELIGSGEARGESSRKSKDWSGLAAGWTRGASATGGMESSNFQETIIGEATSKAVDGVVAWLNQKIPQMAAKERSIEGMVANVSGASIVITVGANDSVQPGDRFEICKVTGVVKDPETKEVIDRVTVKVGEFVVHNVRDRTSSGEYGGEPISMDYTQGYAARLMK